MTDRSLALDAVFRPVPRSTTLGETEARLGNAIRIGILAPGTRLPPERDLARLLCINRSTLHEALTALAQGGYLFARRGANGGTFVCVTPPLSVGLDADPNRDDSRDLLDYRVGIELATTMLAIKRARPADLERLGRYVANMRAATTFEDYRRADAGFHLQLAGAAHSPRLVGEMAELHGALSDLVAPIVHCERRLTRSNAQHTRLVTLLRRRELDPAVRLMRSHMRQTERIIAECRPPSPGNATEIAGPEVRARCSVSIRCLNPRHFRGIR